LMTTYLTYRDSEKKLNIYKLYVARSPKGDVLVSTVRTANFYASNKSKSGVIIEKGNESRCRGYSISQTRGQGRTEGKLCVEISDNGQSTYTIRVSTDEILDRIHRDKKVLDFRLRVRTHKVVGFAGSA
jgi:hypothetical protein